MTWRVRIVPDAMVDGIAIQAVDRLGDGRRVQRIWTVQDEVVSEPHTAMPSPSLTLGDDLGRALLDALAEHYGHTSSGRQQRADFEHERGRVDRFIDYLTAGDATR